MIISINVHVFFMPDIGLHSAMACFMEFKHVCDLWIILELNMTSTFISVFCSIGFLQRNLCVFRIYLHMPKESRE